MYLCGDSLEGNLIEENKNKLNLEIMYGKWTTQIFLVPECKLGFFSATSNMGGLV
jgi:hypothetical protein